MKNKKVLKILTSWGLFATLTASTVALASCSSESKVPVDEKSDPLTSTYFNVRFEGIEEGVTFIGQTSVRVEKGTFFASVRKPTPNHGQLKFDHWTDNKQTKVAISPKTKIDKNMTIYPVFKDEVDLNKCMGVAAIEDTTLSIDHVNSGITTFNQDIQYSTNYGEQWINVDEQEQNHIFELSPGDTIFFKGNNPNGINAGGGSSDNIRFNVAAGGAINIAGSIMGLIDNATGTVDTIPDANCFEGLFQATDDNYGIKFVSDDFLPATTLTPSCYLNLFNGQEELMSAPWLPATGLFTDCYKRMFADCPLIDFIKVGYTGNFYSDTAPNYPYTEGWLANNGQAGTFIYNGSDTPRDTSSIPSDWTIYEAPKPVDPEHFEFHIDISCDEEPTDGLFVDNHPYQFKAIVKNEPASNGDIYQAVTWVSSNTDVATVNPATGVVTPVRASQDGEECIIYAYSKVDQTVAGMKEIKVRDVDTDALTYFVASEEGETMSWDYGGTGTLPSFKYSTDGQNWFNFIAGNPVAMTKDTIYYIKGNNPNGLSNGIESNLSHTRFIFGNEDGEEEPRIYIGGVASGLLDDGRENIKDIPCDFCFNELYRTNNEIADIDKDYLNCFDSLSKGCYRAMFQYSENFNPTEPMVLPNVLTEQCYLYMFRGCSSLTQPSVLNQDTLQRFCYKGMYANCTSLTSTPVLPAAESVFQCYYQMFENDTALTSIGTIGLDPNLVLADSSCLEMFYGVSSDRFIRGEEVENPFFTCPILQGPYDKNPVQDMFRWNTLDHSVDPTAGEKWGWQ